MSQSNWVHLDVARILKETDAAFLCSVNGEQVWLPKSQVADPENYAEGDTDVTLSVTEWLARQKGLEAD